MIGNDLVDLRAARMESNWERSGFLDKLFCTSEKEDILRSEDPFMLVWTYWTMKEAAYKIYSRSTGNSLFAPAKLHCTINRDLHHGTVSYTGIVYYTATHYTDKFIHTTAAEAQEKLDHIRTEIIAHNGITPEYVSKNPACVSHHGSYLALVY